MSNPYDDARFDIHQHVGGLIGIPGASTASAGAAADLQKRLAFMDRFGIGQAALMPGHGYAAPRGLPDTQAINDAVLAVADLAPDRFPAPIGTVEPRHGLKAIGELERLHAAGFKGLSWHHRMQGLPIDHPVMFDIVTRMSELGLLVMVHCYANADFEAPWRLRRLAEMFPTTAFVALDAMTSPENLEQIIAVASVRDNVSLDLTSTVLGPAGVRACVARVGADRLVFGTNYYSMSERDHLGEAEALEGARLSSDVERTIGGDAARRLFGFESSDRRQTFEDMTGISRTK